MSTVSVAERWKLHVYLDSSAFPKSHVCEKIVENSFTAPVSCFWDISCCNAEVFTLCTECALNISIPMFPLPSMDLSHLAIVEEDIGL